MAGPGRLFQVPGGQEFLLSLLVLSGLQKKKPQLIVEVPVLLSGAFYRFRKPVPEDFPVHESSRLLVRGGHVHLPGLKKPNPGFLVRAGQVIFQMFRQRPSSPGFPLCLCHRAVSATLIDQLSPGLCHPFCSCQSLLQTFFPDPLCHLLCKPVP